MQDLSPIPDCVFDSNNEFEIPNLRLDIQPKCVEIPFLCYGEQKRTTPMNGKGTLHFYTDDYRFNSVFEHPEKILKYDPANIVEPNFSLYNETPISFGMQDVYKKRFIARALQERGIGVFVDLNVANKFYALNLLGVPIGYSSFCTRGYSDRLPALEFEHQIASAMAHGNKLTFVVYGGGALVKEWCASNGSVYVTPIIAIKNKIKSIERMKSNVAILKSSPLLPEIPALAEIENPNELFQKQVEDYREVASLIKGE